MSCTLGRVCFKVKKSVVPSPVGSFTYWGLRMPYDVKRNNAEAHASMH